VERFTAGYRKATEELVAIKRESKKRESHSPEYKAILALTRKMFGADLSSDDDADGLISDAVFVGLPGNYSFFQDKGNLSGFDVKQRAALRLAEELGDARNPRDFEQAHWDYTRVKGVGDCRATVRVNRSERFVE